MAAEEEARKAEEEEEKKRAVYELEDGPPVVVYLDLQQIRCGDDVAGSLCSEVLVVLVAVACYVYLYLLSGSAIPTGPIPEAPRMRPRL